MLESNYYCNLGQHHSNYRSDSFSEMMMMMLWIEQYETGWAGMGGNTFLDQNLESVQWWVTVFQAEIQLTMWLVNTGRDSITTQANTSDLHCIITWSRGEIIVIWLYDVDGSTRGIEEGFVSREASELISLTTGFNQGQDSRHKNWINFIISGEQWSYI